MKDNNHKKDNPNRDSLEPKPNLNEYNKGRHGTPPPPSPKPQQDDLNESNESEGLPGWTPPRDDD